MKASVRVAVVPPAAAVAEAMDRPGIAVTSAKLDVITPLPKVVPDRVTVTVAPLRSASVSAAGLVDTEASNTVTSKSRLVRSLAARFASASCAWTVTAEVPATMGVPQRVRCVVPGQPAASVPVASNVSPDGRPATV